MRVGVVEVNAGAHGLDELREREAGGPVRGDLGTQVARDEQAGRRVEVHAPLQIRRRVDMLRLTQVRIASNRIGGVRVAVVAPTLAVHDVAAPPHEARVLAAEVDGERRDREADQRLRGRVLSTTSAGGDHDDDETSNQEY